MSKKKRKVISKKKLKEQRLAGYPQPVFSIGDIVQVNDDVMDANWTDLPIGGWVGEITKIHRKEDEPEYDLIWTEETLKKSNPIFEQLASLEDFKWNEYQNLLESELHLFPGGSFTLVEPGDISNYTDRPLDSATCEDRLRMIFGTKPLEWFPMPGENDEEDERLLRIYHDYLSQQLVFPFKAEYIKYGNGRKVKLPFTVEKLIDLDLIQADEDEYLNIYCSGTDPHGKLIETKLQKISVGNIPQKQLLNDYRFWIGEFDFDEIHDLLNNRRYRR